MHWPGVEPELKCVCERNKMKKCRSEVEMGRGGRSSSSVAAFLSFSTSSSVSRLIFKEPIDSFKFKLSSSFACFVLNRVSAHSHFNTTQLLCTFHSAYQHLFMDICILHGVDLASSLPPGIPALWANGVNENQRLTLLTGLAKLLLIQLGHWLQAIFMHRRIGAIRSNKACVEGGGHAVIHF